jgi:hypothetical protein
MKTIVHVFTIDYGCRIFRDSVTTRTSREARRTMNQRYTKARAISLINRRGQAYIRDHNNDLPCVLDAREVW